MEASKLWRCPYLNSRIGALKVGTVASGVPFDAISRDSDAELGNLEIGTQTENNHPNITSLRQSQEVVSESVQSLNEDNVEKKEPKTGQQRRGKCFYYDTPFMEDTGVWIPVSVPPMLESDQKEQYRGLYANGGYFPEDDMGLGNCIEEEKELTTWDVIAEMLLVARGKVSAMASADSYACRISWMSDYLLEEAWKEMAQTVTDASFGKVNEILEAEPPRLFCLYAMWLYFCSS